MKTLPLKWLSALSILFATCLWARTASFPFESPSLNRKVRNLGMGNVGVALQGTPESSPFYNPAGLNDLKEAEIAFFMQTADVSKGSIDLVKELGDLGKDIGDESDPGERTRLLNDFVQKHYGEYNHFRYSVELFRYTRPNMAMGLVVDERLDVVVRDQSPGTHFEVRNLGDIALFFGGAYGAWDKLLQVGLMCKPTVRFSLDEGEDEYVDFADVTSEDAQGDPVIKSQFQKIYKERRFGLGVDIGLKSNLAFPFIKSLPFYSYLKPEAGLTWQDMGSPMFGEAPNNPQSISVGVAVHPDLWKLKNAVALDLRDVNQERSFLSKFHFGIESRLPWIVTGRVGVSQGYLTAGATVDLWFAKIDGAIYFEEVGTYTHADGNLRWAATLGFNI